MPTVVNISDPVEETSGATSSPPESAPVSPPSPPPVSKPKTAAAIARQAAKEAKENIPILPSPPVPKLGGQLWAAVTTKDGPEKAVKVWQYWHDTDQKYPGRIQVYVYRLYPICIRLTKEERDEMTEGIGDKIYGFPDYEYDPSLENFSNYVLTRWGSGNYRFIFKDSALGHVLFALLLNGVWDWNYPPNVDLARVDKDHPNNKTFLDELARRTGRGNGSNLYTKGETAMAEAGNTAATTAAMGVVGPLVNTVRELATGKRDQVDTGAIVEGVNKSWSNTFDTILGMVKANQQQQAVAADPATHVKQVMDMAKSIAPDMSGIVAQLTAVQTAAQSRVDKLIELQLKQSEDRQRLLEEELREMRRERERERNNPRAAADPAANDPLAGLERILAIKDKLMDLTAGGGDGDDGGRPERKPWYADLVQVATPILGQMVQALMIYMQGQQVAGGQPPRPAIQPMPGAMPQPQPPPAPVPANANTQSSPNPNPQSQPQEDSNTAMHPYTLFFNQLAGPLLNHLNNPDQDGIDFAIWFIHGHGRTQYAQVAGLGKDALLAAMAQYAPQLWAAVSVPSRDVAGLQVPTPQFAEFLGEFLDTDTVQRALAGEDVDTDAEADTEPDTATASAPVEVIQGKPDDAVEIKPKRRHTIVDVDPQVQ